MSTNLFIDYTTVWLADYSKGAQHIAYLNEWRTEHHYSTSWRGQELMGEVSVRRWVE